MGSAVAGSVVPADSGFTDAFLLMAGVALLAGLVAMVIPVGAHRHEPAQGGALADADAGAAAPLPEPAYAGRR